MDEYEYKTFDTGKVWLEAGWYMPEYLRIVIEIREEQDKRLRESMELWPKEKTKLKEQT
jgi:hypothetical protein